MRFGEEIHRVVTKIREPALFPLAKLRHPESLRGASIHLTGCQSLELVPQVLVVNIVVELHLRRFHHGSQ